MRAGTRPDDGGRPWQPRRERRYGRRMSLQIAADQARRLVLHPRGADRSAAPTADRRPPDRPDRAPRLPPGRQHQHGRARPSHDPVHAQRELSAGAAAPRARGPGAAVRALDLRRRSDSCRCASIPTGSCASRASARALERRFRRWHGAAHQDELERVLRADARARPDHGARPRRGPRPAGRRLVGLAPRQDRARVPVAHRPSRDRETARLPEGLRSGRAGDPRGRAALRAGPRFAAWTGPAAARSSVSASRPRARSRASSAW